MTTEKTSKTASEGFGWDSKINPADAEKKYPLLPEGPAMFTVLKLERKRKEIGEMGMQNVAVVTVALNTLVDEYDKEQFAEKTEVEINLILVKSLLWKLLQFFVSIGQRKHGDEGIFVPNWAKIEGEFGRCTIGHRKGKKNDKMFIDIKEFLAPDEAKEDDSLSFG